MVCRAMSPLKNGNFCTSSRKAKISTTGIYLIFRGLKFEPDTEIGQKVPFYKGLNWTITEGEIFDGIHRDPKPVQAL